MYSFGEAEEVLGKALKESGAARESLVVATKVFAPASRQRAERKGDPNARGLSRQHILAGCEASLRRLGTDYIDLYQAHGFDLLTPIEETLRALDDLVRQGKVRYLGCSNWPARHLMKALCLADADAGAFRFFTGVLFAGWARSGARVTAALPGGGTGRAAVVAAFGRFSDRQVPAGRAIAGWSAAERIRFPPIDEDRGFDAVEALDTLAKDKAVSIAQLALAWLLAERGVSSVIIGANKMAQLEDNLKAVECGLQGTSWERISATTQPLKLYPQWMVERQNSVWR